MRLMEKQREKIGQRGTNDIKGNAGSVREKKMNSKTNRQFHMYKQNSK